MPNAHDLCRGQQRLHRLVEFAVREGWTVSRTAGGYLQFEKAGLPPIFTRFTASNRRAARHPTGGRHG